MIESVLLFKRGGVSVKYQNGKHKEFSINAMPQTAKRFLQRSDLKIVENDIYTAYKITV